MDHVSSKTIVGTIFDTNFSLFYYSYDIIKPFAQFEGIHILDVSDIAAMKLHALEDRGTRRDFVDIYILTKDFTLEEMFEFYEKKYHCLDDHIYSLVKSLSYFTNAEHDTQMPHMLVDIK